MNKIEKFLTEKIATEVSYTRRQVYNEVLQFVQNQNVKDTLTTGQIAIICNVAPRTVTKWIDSGKLVGYRIPSSNRARRVLISSLRTFMTLYKIPTDKLDNLTNGN